MKKIILISGPPGSGKDYIAAHIKEFVKGQYKTRIDKFARILKERTHALYGFPNRNMWYYENCKDIPNNDFLGISPREAYIKVSEIYFKTVHGKDIFAKLLYESIKSLDWELLLISDSGFIEEANYLINKYDINNIYNIQLESPNCSFERDSRSYFTIPNLNSVRVINNKDEASLKEINTICTQLLRGS